MFRKVATVLAAGALVFSLAACSSGSNASGDGEGGGQVAIITVDLANSYWQAEADTAEAALDELGYTSTVNAHGGDPDKQNQLIDTAISNKVKAIILDPAGADESVAAVQ